MQMVRPCLLRGSQNASKTDDLWRADASVDFRDTLTDCNNISNIIDSITVIYCITARDVTSFAFDNIQTSYIFSTFNF